MSIRVSRLLIAAAISLAPLYASTAHAACSALTNGVVPLARFDSAGDHTVFTQPSGAAPEGILAYDTTNDLLKVCDGSAWQNAAIGGSVATDSLDFTEFKDAMTLDASTDIAASGTNVLSITNTGTGNSFVVNDAASDTTPFLIDAAGNVGIGTASPSAELHIVKANAIPSIILQTAGSGGGDSGLKLLNSGSAVLASLTSVNGTGEVRLSTGSSYYPTFYSNGAEAMRISTAGNVGIGTISPTNLLSLGGGAARTIWMERSATSAAAGNSLTLQAGGTKSGNTDQNGGDLVLSSGTATGTGSSNIAFKTHPAGTTGTADTTATTAMTILGNGNVGIGTSNPSKKLEINVTTNDGIAIKNTAGGLYSSVTLNDTANTSGGILYYQGANAFMNNADTLVLGSFAATTPVRIVTNGINRMTVDTTGNVGIGQTSPQSLLSVGSAGYAQFEKTFAGAPTGTDCDAANEAGRVTYDTTGNAWYVCEGTGGWVSASGAGGTPGGATTQVQFNNAGAFAGDAGLAWDNTNKNLEIRSSLATNTTAAPSLKLVRAMSGIATNNKLGSIDFLGNKNATGEALGARIEARGSAFWNDNTDTPTKIVMSVARDATNTLEDVMELSQGGPLFNGVGRLGTPGSAYQSVLIAPGAGNIPSLTFYDQTNYFSMGIDDAGTRFAISVDNGHLNNGNEFSVDNDGTIQMGNMTVANSTAVVNMGRTPTDVRDGTLLLQTMGTVVGGKALRVAQWSTDETVLYDNGGAVINEQGNAVNVRIEGDTDQNLFFTDGTNDRIGIGTATPSTTLSLGGTVARTIGMERSATSAATGNSLTLQAGGTKSGNSNQNGGDLALSSGTATGTGSSNIAFRTHPAGTTGTADTTATTAVTILGNGNVGIGTTTPEDKLHIRATKDSPSAPFLGGIILSDDTAQGAGVGGALVFSGKYTTAGAYTTAAAIHAYKENSTSGQFGFNLAFNTRVDGGSNTEKMRITSAGNVGIGQTSPQSLLSVGSGGYAQFEKTSAGAPTGTDCDAANEAGRVIFDTTNNYWYVCEGLGGWTNASGGGSVGADSLDFTEFKDAMTLDVSTEIAASGTNVLSITNTGTGNSFLINDVASDTSPFVIDASGNVGMGLTAPTQKLEVLGGTSGVTTALRVNGGGTTAGDGSGMAFGYYYNGSYPTWDLGRIYAVSEAPASNWKGSLTFHTNSGGSATSLSERMRITADGNVGIGTTSPDEQFEVENTVLSSVIQSAYAGTAGYVAALELKNTHTGGREWGLWAGNASTGTLGSGFGIRDITASTYRMVIDATGNVGIGTASPTLTGGAGSSGLHISGSAGSAGTPVLRLESTGTSPHSYELIVPGTNGNFGLYDTTNAAYRLYVLGSSGNVGIGTTSPSAHLQVGGAVSASSWTTTGLAFDSNAATYTDTSSAAAATVATRVVNSFGVPTLASTNAITVTDAATLYIAGPPTAGTNTTITRGYALDVNGAYNRIGTTGASYLISKKTGEMLVGEDTAAIYFYRGFGGGAALPLLIGSTNTMVTLTTNGQERLRVDSAGKVGIGTTNPMSKLHVSVPATNTISTDDTASTAGITVAGTGNLVRLQLGAGGSTMGPYGGWIQANFDNGGGSNGIEPLLLNPMGGNVGIGTLIPVYNLSLGGNAARTIGMERHLTSNTAGNSLTLQSGGATSAATDKNGGDLVLSSGTATGTGSSNITFKTTPAGTTGTADRAPATAMTILGNGNVGIGTTSPQSTLHVPDGKYAQFEDFNAGAPPAADCDADTERGRQSIDTTNFRLYICMGATRGWDYAALND